MSTQIGSQITPEQLQQMLSAPAGSAANPTADQLSASANAAAQADLMAQMNAASQPAVDTAAFAQPEQPKSNKGMIAGLLGLAAAIGGGIYFWRRGKGKPAADATGAAAEGLKGTGKKLAEEVEALPDKIRSAVKKIMDGSGKKKHINAVAEHFVGEGNATKQVKKALNKEIGNIKTEVDRQPVSVRSEILKSKGTATRLSYAAEHPKADMGKEADKLGAQKLIDRISINGGKVGVNKVGDDTRGMWKKVNNALDAILDASGPYRGNLTTSQLATLTPARTELNAGGADWADALATATKTIRDAGLHKKDGGLKAEVIGRRR